MYNEGSLTEQQARQIIGDKMNSRIEIINDWIHQNGYHFLLHSTNKECAEEILSSDGLHYPKYRSIDSKEEIMEYCNISKKDLDALENWVKTNNQGAMLKKNYETHPPVESATVVGVQALTAKKLLEFNHNNGSVTVVFCVPNKRPKQIGTPTEWTTVFTNDPYLRRRISGRINKDGKVEFVSKYFYPAEGILFAYDRENNKIKINDNFNEECFLDNDSPQKGLFQKGELLESLKKVSLGQNKSK